MSGCDLSGRDPMVDAIGRIYDLEYKLSEAIRRLVSGEPLDDLVRTPLSAVEVEEILDPPPEPRIIVGGYYKTKEGNDAHIAWKVSNGTWRGLLHRRETGEILQCIWKDDGRRCNYGRVADNALDLSTYQPKPFEE